MPNLNTRPFLSVVVPAFNEERRIGNTLISIIDYLSTKEFSSEIIVVNDGSTDSTADFVNSLASNHPQLTLHNLNENMGKGFAVKSGMLKANGEIRLFMDADNSTSIDHFDLMLPMFEGGSDVVIGSRRAPGAIIAVHQSWIRENLGKVFNLIVQLINGAPFKDTQTGFKAFTAKACELIFPLQTVTRWAFDLEIILIALRAGLKIEEAPVTWINDSQTRVTFAGMLGMLRDIVKIRINSQLGRYDTTRRE